MRCVERILRFLTIQWIALAMAILAVSVFLIAAGPLFLYALGTLPYTPEMEEAIVLAAVGVIGSGAIGVSAVVRSIND